jgi:hypothetical protein
MNRRDFTKSLAAGGVVVALRSLSGVAQNKPPQVAITMDDFSWRTNTVGSPAMSEIARS